MAAKPRLFLLDAYALIFRGYYAFIKNPRINSQGMDTSAIMGFMNSLLDVINRERPDHMAVCFDKGGSVARTEQFSEYKANRDETPEAIKIAVPIIHDLLHAMNIPVIEKEGFEADDIIGTLAKQAEKENFEVFMMTPDKDFAQLVSENIFMYRPARMGNGIEIWGIPEVCEKFEVESPLQVIDYLGMMGDAVDNIPGLPGVGDKTAKKFIKQFGSMEALLANTDQLQGKLKEKIENHKEQGVLSKELARILLDVPVTFDAERFALSEPDKNRVNTLFDILEFRRIKERFAKLFSAEPELSTPNESDQKAGSKIKPVSDGQQFDLFAPPGSGVSAGEAHEIKKQEGYVHHYQHVTTPQGRALLLASLLEQKEVCFDTETTSLKSLEAELVGIAFSWAPGTGYYVPFPTDQQETKALLDAFKPFFEHPTIEKIGHNLKYDLKVLRKYGLRVSGPFFDTMVAHYLINPDMRHNMDVLAETYLHYTPQSITELIGKKGANQGNMRDVPLEKQTEYAVEDADITLQLKDHFLKELESSETLSLYRDVELPLMEVLTEMESAGIALDATFLNDFSKTLLEDIAALEKTIFETAGEDFNLASPKQLGVVLFEKLKLVDKPKKTKTGQYSTAEEVLSYLAKDHPIVAQILDWRSLQKLHNTYVSVLPKEVNPHTGRIHTVYNQAVAATGRLSSNNPNLQNIPIRTPRGQQVRKAFVAKSEEHVLLAADYSQIELRIIAALSQDPEMIQAFLNNEDIHTATAAKVFDVAPDAVTRAQRSHAKTVNFGIIYGVSAFGLSQQTDLSRSESKALIETYYATYPKLRTYIHDQVDFAREHGYVETVLGRRRYLQAINSQNAVVRGAAERNAVNAPIQGSAADIIKLAMIAIQKELNQGQWQTKMLLQVHDELVFEVPRTELESVKTMVKTAMENAFSLAVPLVVDMGVGKNWLEAH